MENGRKSSFLKGINTMYIIVGLGNPGQQYEMTRHNVGFEVVEQFAYDNQIKIQTLKHKALTGQGIFEGNKVILARPMTYMNLSGESVRALLDFYKETTDHLIVIYDDCSMEIGKLRIREKGSAGGHNGIKSIIQHLGTDSFIRIKVGIGQKPEGWNLADYVLGKFTPDEIPNMKKSIVAASRTIENIIKMGTYKAMNEINRL